MKNELEIVDGLIKTMESAETAMVMGGAFKAKIILYMDEVGIIKQALQERREDITNG